MKIRKSLVYPFLILSAIVGLVMLFIGVIVKNPLESTLEKSVGSEVNIKRISVGYFPFSVAIEGMQISNPEKLTHNSLSFDLAQIDIQFLPLLKKKVIIDAIVLENLDFDTERSQVAALIQTKQDESNAKSSEEPNSKSKTQQLAETVKNQEYVAAPKIDLKKDRLSNSNSVLDDLDQRKASIEAAYERLTSGTYDADVETIKVEAQALTSRKIKSVSDLSKLTKDYKSVEKKVKALNAAVSNDYNSLKADIEAYSDGVQRLKKASEKDIMALSSEIAAEKLKDSSIAQRFLTPLFDKRINQLKKGKDMASKTVSALKSPTAPKKRWRRQGRLVTFENKRVQQPKFLLKSLKGSGPRLQVSIEQLSDDFFNYPFKANLKAEDVHKMGSELDLKIVGVDATVLFDKCSLEAIPLMDEGDNQLAMQSSVMKLYSTLSYDPKQEGLVGSFKVLLKDSVFESSGFDTSNMLDKLLLNVLSRGDDIDVLGRFNTAKNDLSLNSSIDDTLKAAFKEESQREIDAKKNEIRKQVNDLLKTDIKEGETFAEGYQKSLKKWKDDINKALKGVKVKK